MEDLFESFGEAIHLRLQWKTGEEAQQLFQQFEEQASMLGDSPQLAIVRRFLFEADVSSIEEMWKSFVKVIEESLEAYQVEDQIINRFEALVALAQGYIYLNQPEKASSHLEQAQELLIRIEQEKHLQTTPFSSWEPVIINIKKQQIESLSNQIAALETPN